MRQVKAAELGKPFKEVARRGAKAAEAKAAAKAAEVRSLPSVCLASCLCKSCALAFAALPGTC